MQVPWWLCPGSGKAYQPVTIVKLVLIKQSGTDFFKIFYFNPLHYGAFVAMRSFDFEDF